MDSVLIVMGEIPTKDDTPAPSQLLGICSDDSDGMVVADKVARASDWPRNNVYRVRLNQLDCNSWDRVKSYVEVSWN